MSRVLLGYDIQNAKRRRWALRQLRALTACYQESFFDCMLDRRQAEGLWERLTEELDPAEDGLILARVDDQQPQPLGERWTTGGDRLFLVL